VSKSKLEDLRGSGFQGPVDRDGNAVMSRTDASGTPLFLFEGGTGHGTPDEARADELGGR